MVRVVQTNSNNPYYNLALEEVLFRHCEKTKEFILYLWQNDNTIVIGRNQTVYTECNISYAKSHNVKIARRMTGGGAVYHDLGNLNYSIIVPKEHYNRSKSTQVILNALHMGGVEAIANGRNDILLNEKKISGNAYYSTQGAGLHHGTLLVDSNLSKMELLLNVRGSKVSKAGIVSIKSRVANINETHKIGLEKLKETIIVSFIKNYCMDGNVLYGYDEIRKDSIDEIIKMYSSEEWIMNQVAEYSLVVAEKYEWGMATISCELAGNSKKVYSIISDSLYPDIIKKIENLFNKEDSDYSINFDLLIEEEKKIISDLYDLRLKLQSQIEGVSNEKN